MPIEWTEQQAQLIDEAKRWNPERFLEHLRDVIGEYHAKETFEAAIRKVVGPRQAVLASDPTGDVSKDLFPAIRAHTAIRIAMVLPAVGIDVPLDELLRGHARRADPRELKLTRLSERLDRTLRFDDVTERLLHSFAEDARKKVMPLIEQQRTAIITHRTARDDGYLIAPEIRALGECSAHIRVVTNHLNFGVQWDINNSGDIVPHRTLEFDTVADRVRASRFTFVVPATPPASQPGRAPFHRPPDDLTWEEFVSRFKEVYTYHGGITPELWAQRATFVHTPLPIPVGYVVFGMSKQGIDGLAATHQDLHDWIRQDTRYCLSTKDGGAFAAIVVPDRGVATSAALLDQHALLHASDAFVDYVASAGLPLSCCEGLPLSINTEFRHKTKLTKDRLIERKFGLPLCGGDVDQR